VEYWRAFSELIVMPFQQIELVWGIVPLYFGWILNELTSDKASYRTALQTGFSFLWAGAQWTYLAYHGKNSSLGFQLSITVSMIVTIFVIVTGALALISGLRKKFPKYGSFLGHSRFSNYFMIAIYPMQADPMLWSWKRLTAIVLFAVPIWLLFHFVFKPLRK
jgi:hypothetical protein